MRAEPFTPPSHSTCRHCAIPTRWPVEPELGGLCADCYVALEEDGIAAALEHAKAGPPLRLASPAAAAGLRRELVALVLDVHPPIAVAIVATFDFGAPLDRRGFLWDRLAQRDHAWSLCCEAAGVRDDRVLARLRDEVREELAPWWSGDVVAWFVDQVDAVALATAEPLPGPVLWAGEHEEWEEPVRAVIEEAEGYLHEATIPTEPVVMCEEESSAALAAAESALWGGTSIGTRSRAPQ